MNSLLYRLATCVMIGGSFLYSYLDMQNKLTSLKMQVPKLQSEIRLIHEEMDQLVYSVDQFENPSHLMELAHRPEFAHLKHPLYQEIVTVSEALALNDL